MLYIKENIKLCMYKCIICRGVQKKKRPHHPMVNHNFLTETLLRSFPNKSFSNEKSSDLAFYDNREKRIFSGGICPSWGGAGIFAGQ